MTIIIKKNHFISLMLLFIIAVFSITIITTNKNQKLYRSRADENITPTPEASPSAQIALLETMIESKNIETDKLLDSYEQTTDEEEKQKITSSLETNLDKRNKDQLSLLQWSPSSVYQKAFSQEMIDKLNKISDEQDKELKVEKRLRESITGTVNTTIYDNFDNNISYTTATFIPDSNEEEEINFYPADNQTFLSGTKVTLNDAIRIDEDNNNQVLGVSAVYAQEQEGLQPQEQNRQPQSHLVAVKIETIDTPPLDTLGEQKILVLLAKAKDVDESQLLTFQEIEDMMTGKFKSFYERASYNKMTISADVVKKWYDLKITSKYKPFTIINGVDYRYHNEFFKKKDEKNILTKAYLEGVNIKNYQRVIFIVGGFGVSGGYSHFGKRNFSIKNNRFKVSILVAHLRTIPPDEFFFYTLLHEFGHNLGLEHAASLLCNSVCVNRLYNQYAFAFPINYNSDPGSNYIKFRGREYIFEEYGNVYTTIMGRGTRYDKYNLNLYEKIRSGWINDNTEVKLKKLNPDNFAGNYKISPTDAKNGIIGLWLPFNSNQKSKNNNLDFFISYISRLNAVAIEMVDNYNHQSIYDNTYDLHHKYTDPNTDELKVVFVRNSTIVDELNEVKIRVRKINEADQTASVSICSLNQLKDSYGLVPIRAGNEQMASVNIFENDLRGKNNTTKPLTIKEDFLIENTSLCFNKKYTIDQSSIIINQGNLYFSSPQFMTLSTEEVSPLKTVNNSFTTVATINSPALPDTTMEFTVIETNTDKGQKEEPITKKLVYQFHVVPSTDEYKNDLEPFIINIKDKDINNKDFNHLETEKGQTLVFTSKIANNSRNPDGNKSSDFIMKWYMQDDKGNNIIPPHTQRHDGIPPKSIDDAQPAVLTWTIPNDLSAGDYKIILEVDPNNRLQEFNENNNLIWRYFSVVG